MRAHAAASVCPGVDGWAVIVSRSTAALVDSCRRPLGSGPPISDMCAGDHATSSAASEHCSDAADAPLSCGLGKLSSTPPFPPTF